MSQLIFYKDGYEVLRYPLSADEVQLGRHPDNDISLPDPEISRHHVRLHRRGDSFQLEDISRNGTRLKGEVVDTALLSDQDVFAIGPWRILYERAGGDSDTETAISAGPASGAQSGREGAAFCGMVGASPVMQRVFELIEKAAVSDLPVMIQGETGTGKELVARALHQMSQRSGPFVAINCGAISPNLIESELFGHERGAFTGAVSQHRGAFEQADTGTLFLDEIGELPLELQPKLLRAIEELNFRRVGGSSDLQVNLRIVAATHRELRQEIEAQRFREDLYYRLMGVPIQLPALKERVEDIPVLAAYFLKQVSPGSSRTELSEQALQRLQAHPWQGNIRELKNVLARSLLLGSGSVLSATDIQFLELAPEPVDTSLAGLERGAIQAAMRAMDGNKKLAAERLGIAKSTLFRKLKEYGLPEA